MRAFDTLASPGARLTSRALPAGARTRSIDSQPRSCRAPVIGGRSSGVSTPGGAAHTDTMLFTMRFAALAFPPPAGPGSHGVVAVDRDVQVRRAGDVHAMAAAALGRVRPVVRARVVDAGDVLDHVQRLPLATGRAPRSGTRPACPASKRPCPGPRACARAAGARRTSRPRRPDARARRRAAAPSAPTPSRARSRAA